MTYGQLAEWYLTKKAVERDKIIPNQPKWEDIKRRKSFTYVGGFVKEPIAGLHENIAVLDFRSLYPSIIAAFNISPETLNYPCSQEERYQVPERDYWFCKEKRGFVSEVIEELIQKRGELKEKMKRIGEDTLEYRILDNRQLSLKIVGNATYGMFAFAGAKWYCRECAESSAAFGRFFIQETIQEAEKENFRVVYADTDSCFIEKELPRNELDKEIESFLSYINGKLPGVMELELQGIYKRGIFIPRGTAPGTAKKRYALIDEDDNLVIRGLETVRRDWCSLAKDVQRQVLVYTLKDRKVGEAIQYVREIIGMLKRREVPLKDLTIYEQLTKPLSQYKQIGPAVATAQKMQRRGRKVGEGMLVMFAITHGEGSISERAEPIEDVTIDEIDENYYIDHQIVPAALRVLQVLEVDREKLMEKSLSSR
jgi:DNA polymerase I/DNA polymerase-2